MTITDTPIPLADDDELRLACLREGIRDADEGRYLDAELRFRQVLASVRGSGTRPERLAASSLLTLFAREGRDVEALILARRHVALALSGGDVEDLCFAYASITDALARLEDWRRLDHEIAEFERALGAYGGRHDGGLRRHLLRACIRRELARNNVVVAEALLARIRVLDAGDPGPLELRHPTLVCEAQIGLAAGRPDRARAALASIPAKYRSIQDAFLSARCTLAIDGADAAVAALARVVDALESPDAAREGIATRLRVARQAAQFAERVGAPVALTSRAFEVAAAMVLLRASEIERAAREMPELATVDPQDARALAAYRIRFASEQKDLLAAVADLLRKRAAAGDLPTWAHGTPDASARICPWCLRIRTADGTILPIGHYVPSAAGLAVRRTACDSCESRLREP